MSPSLAIVALFTTFFLVVSPVAAAKSAPSTQYHTWNVDVGVQLRESATEGMVFLPREIWIDVGDTIIWHAASDEEHTVTFLRTGQKQPAFNRHDPLQITPQGGDHYDGHSYYNSGLMSNFPPGHEQDATTYSLTFDTMGTFTYNSLLQSAMTGIIHVRATGTFYPFTDGVYQQKATATIAKIRKEGEQLAIAARKYANNHYIIAGVGNSQVSDFVFTPGIVTIHAGETVTFQQADGAEPHTITFGSSNTSNDRAYGNPEDFDGVSAFNSGWLCTTLVCAQTTYQVTFTRPGTFVLRDDLNKYTMLATVIVFK